MAEGSQFQEFPAYVQKSSRSSKPLVVIIILILLVLIAGGGYYFWQTTNKSSQAKAPVPVTVKPTVLPTEELSSTPSGDLTPSAKTTAAPAPTKAASKTTLDRSKLTVAVLNGSGVAGAAKGTSSHLTSLGYVTSVDNADAFTYKGLTVKVKKSKSDYLSMLKKDVTDSADGASVTASVDDSISTDAEVIVGK